MKPVCYRPVLSQPATVIRADRIQADLGPHDLHHPLTFPQWLIYNKKRLHKHLVSQVVTNRRWTSSTSKLMGEIGGGDLIVQFPKADLHLVDEFVQPFVGQFRHRRCV